MGRSGPELHSVWYDFPYTFPFMVKQVDIRMAPSVTTVVGSQFALA